MTGVLTVTILGCGSSGGVPRVGGDWGACDPGDPRNRRRRCSLLLQWVEAGAREPTIVLIDTSPDLREQLLAADVRRLDAIVFSHDHADQSHGIDDVRALVLSMRRRIPVFMDAPTRATLARRFRYIFEGEGAYPAILSLADEIVPYEPFTADGPGGPLTLTPLLQDHGGTPSLGFRCGPFAYSNDVAHLPQETLERLQTLELWIVDALRYAPHPTHAHVDRALSWIAALRPARTILTNLHVDLDYKTLAAALPAGVEPAYDGLSIGLYLT